MELSNGHLSIYVGSKKMPELGRVPIDSLIQQLLRECISWVPRGVSVTGIQWLSDSKPRLNGAYAVLEKIINKLLAK